jgi:hypothetical protein
MNSLQMELSNIADKIKFKELDDVEIIASKINFPDKEIDEIDTTLPASQQLFYYYKNNPLSTATEVAEAFPNLKPAMVASTTFSLFTRGILEREKSLDGYMYKAKVDTYPRYTPEARAANIKAARKKIKREDKPALITKETKPTVVVNYPKPTAENILDTMSVRQAFELYKELHAMFGRRHDSND